MPLIWPSLGISKLSQLVIDGNKDWAGYKLTDLGAPSGADDSARKTDLPAPPFDTSVQAPSITVGTVYQNTQGVPLFISVSFNLYDETGGGGVVSLLIGSTSSPGTVIARGSFDIAATTAGLTLTLCGIIPPGWYYQFTDSGSSKASVNSTFSVY